MLLFLTGCQKQGAAPSNATGQLHHGGAYMVLEDTIVDMGNINKTKAPVADCYLMVENRGDADLVIDEVTPFCECTSAEFPRKPIAPGHRKHIKVTLDTRKMPYQRHFEKELEIKSNAKNQQKPVIIAIKGTISY